MSDDSVSAFTGPDPAHDKEILLYDYSKHLLSLSLLGIGGIISIAQSPQGQKIPGMIVAMVLGILAISGCFSLSCTAAILRARQHNTRVPNSAWLYSRGGMLFLGIGVGAFLSIWIKVML